ncbi:MAG: TrpB-like pyridoxal-phosphate dependent enzyme, partial [Lachnospiraceae bacterium]|nr:TrpB-like pyridoxal-phosphate dependent enzyme [Lachnospiraceae bacterium]
MSKLNVPYKMYLDEKEIPKKWYNVRSDMKTKQAPLLHPGTLKPMTAADLAPVFCEELIAQELDDDTAYYDIPDEIYDFYKI